VRDPKDAHSREPGFRIRHAAEEDAAAIGRILRDLGWFSDINAEAPEESTGRIERTLGRCAARTDHTAFVAEDDAGEVIGYVAVHWLPYLFMKGPEGYVSELFVRRSYRCRGVGTRLLEEVRKEAVRRGASRLMLVNSRNRPSYKRGFYERRGWKERIEAANFVLPLKEDR